LRSPEDGVTAPAPLLAIRDLAVSFDTPGGEVRAVRGVSLEIAKGETVGLVGESGSGKSVTALSILQLLPYPPARHPSGSIRFQDQELLGADEATLRRVRGNRIAMIFQEPMTSLNPLHTIEKQVNEVLFVHKGLSRPAARARTVELLHLVGLPEAERRLDAYPHQLSGGQRQRVMIAMALLLITHDLGIVRKMAARVSVMSQGEIVEAGSTAEIFERPQHPYTRRLLAAEPASRVPASASAAPVVMTAEGVKVWFPVKAGVLRRTVDHVKAVDGVSVTIREGQTVGV